MKEFKLFGYNVRLDVEKERRYTQEDVDKIVHDKMKENVILFRRMTFKTDLLKEAIKNGWSDLIEEHINELDRIAIDGIRLYEES